MTLMLNSTEHKLLLTLQLFMQVRKLEGITDLKTEEQQPAASLLPPRDINAVAD